MRITALSSILAIGVLVAIAGPAHADGKKPLAAARLAALVQPAAYTNSTLAATTDLVRPSVSPPARYLTTSDVAEVVAPRATEIERCYVDVLGPSRRGGQLDLMFVIARDGHVVSLDSAAPGLPAAAAHRLHKCLRTAVEALQFPARRNHTTVIVPYYFQRTDAPNAGPQLSCWNPRGC